jgi:outer membrane protein assembly factor BamB
MPTSGSRRRSRRWIAAGVTLLAVIGGVIAAVLLHDPGNVSHPDLEFTAPTAQTTAQRPPPANAVDKFLWPRYGFDAGRTRYLPDSAGLDPPFRRGWTYRGQSLLEFPPVIRQSVSYLVNDAGVALAIDNRNGNMLWKRHIGTLAAASPAIGRGVLLVPLLSVRPGAGQNPGDGRFTALSQRDGRVLWSRTVPAGTESSPIVWNDWVWFGDQAGNVYALRTSDGHQFWRFHAAGPVKGGPSLANGILYFADYAGHVYALGAVSGRVLWDVSTSGTHFGFGSGNFYSTPAIAFGRVYLGNTDGRVYSFAAHSGKLAWATQTGAYVYASPAVADIPGLGPTVYIGSYDRHFYAFDARSGRIRWSHAAAGRISGSPTIVGNVVYYADLGSKSTTGLDVRTGRVVYRFPDGAFTPVIADDSAVYLVGYASVFQLLPARAVTALGSLVARAPQLASRHAAAAPPKAPKRRVNPGTKRPKKRK